MKIDRFEAVTQGQDQAESLFYAKLPPPLQQQDQSLLSQSGVQARLRQ
jgi:hypothetical protein